MSHLKIYLILVSAIFLLLPGACGLEFSMGTSNGINGASESLKLNAGLDSAIVSSTLACPDDYITALSADGSGELDFDQTFNSLDDGEHVRLTATMSDSVYYNRGYVIEKRAGDEIRVSGSLVVDQGKDIECSAEAWNSLGQSIKVGLIIPEGSLTSYSNYGDAMDESVIASQTAVVPQRTKFSVFSEAKRGFSTQRSSSTLRSSRALNVDTTTAVTATKSSTKSKLKSE